ncbi:Chromatin remodeling protein SHL [Phlyctema vagabunda]|uniref:Chromatin remodeling protein SHL n=1 Tax=Phlyctema vagabunda TaxID=108571 RepID=A0ABR4P7F3_9HELO
MLRNGVKREHNDDPLPPKRLKTSPTPSSVVLADVAFQVEYLSEQSPKGRNAKEFELHTSPFVTDNEIGALDQYYTVAPSEGWYGMRKYNSFVIQDDKYQIGDYVFVKNDRTSQPKNTNEKDFWVARILEIRGADSSHVYALVTWMYWPDELPETKAPHEEKLSPGRRKYHGRRELVASNCMEVLDVLTCAGKADVIQWLEKDDEEPLTTLYWRQTFRRDEMTLSGIRLHCICNGPYCADWTLHGCSNDQCRLWLHPECLLDAVLSKTYTRLIGDSAVEETKKKASKLKKPKKNYTGKFKAEFSFPDVKITDLRRGEGQKTWIEPLICLKCRSPLD